MKNLLALYGMAAFASASMHSQDSNKLSNKKFRENMEDLEDKKKEKERELKLKKGLKEFTFGGNVVWAINEKSANKKAKKRGYI